MKLMVDNDLPFRLAHSLQCIFPEDEIVALRDKFGRANLTDEEWMTALGAEGNWSVVSADRRITRNPIQRNAFLAAGLIGFFFSASLKKGAARKSGGQTPHLVAGNLRASSAQQERVLRGAYKRSQVPNNRPLNERPSRFGSSLRICPTPYARESSHSVARKG